LAGFVSTPIICEAPLSLAAWATYYVKK